MAGREQSSGSLLRVGLLFIVAMVLVLGLLYAYRAQTPAVEQIAVSTALAEIQQGRVRAVSIDGNRAVITLADGSKQVATLAERDDTLMRAIIERNQADPARAIELRVEQQTFGVPGLAIVVGVILSLLPLFLVIALVLLGAFALRRGEAGHRYELLARLADLRDRGVLTEDEFQREKRRLLR